MVLYQYLGILLSPTGGLVSGEFRGFAVHGSSKPNCSYTLGQLGSSQFPSSLSAPIDPLTSSLVDASTPTPTAAPPQSVSDSRPRSNDTGDSDKADLPPVEVKDFGSEHVEDNDISDAFDEARLASSSEPESSALRSTSPSQRTNSGLDDPPSISPSPSPSPMVTTEDTSDSELVHREASGDDADVDVSSAELSRRPSASSASSKQQPDPSSRSRLRPSAHATRNQDPDIPNMSTQDYAYRTPHPDRAMFREPEEGDVQPEEGLTRENMRQLNLQLVGDQVKERDAVERRRRRSQKVQLRRSHSHRSRLSEEEGESPSDGEHAGESSLRRSSTTRRPVPRVPRSRGSLVSYRRNSIGDGAGSLDGRHGGNGSILLDSGTGSTTNSGEPIELNYDLEKERDRVRLFFEKNGYMPAPKQTPENIRRRLRVIRRLGLENPGGHMPGLQRFTRLAATLLKAQMAMVSIIGKDKNWIIAAHGSDLKVVELESAFCAHTVVATGQQCLTVRDAQKDWRFMGNPFVNPKRTAEDESDKKGEGRQDEEGEGGEEAKDDAKASKSSGTGGEDDLGGIRFYAGSPLIVGKGPRAAIIGSLCLLDTKPREFKEEEKVVLSELADCVVSELELVYAQRASIESAKLHQISVDFLRRSLKSRPHEMAGKNRYTQTNSSTASTLSRRESKQPVRSPRLKSEAELATGDHSAIENAILGDDGEIAVGSSSGPTPRHETIDPVDRVDPGQAGSGSEHQLSSKKRVSGADKDQLAESIDIYDEACSEIRSALDAYAVAIVDLSQFHLFYPTFAGSSTGGSSTRRASKTGTQSGPGQGSSRAGSKTQSSWSGDGTIVPNAAGSTQGYSGYNESDAARQGQAEEGDEEFTHSEKKSKRARQTYALKDPTAPSRTPQVLYIPSGRRGGSTSGFGKQGTNEEEVSHGRMVAMCSSS